MRPFYNFSCLQRTLRLTVYVTKKNEYVTASCTRLISLIPNESCCFNRNLHLSTLTKHRNACSKLLQVNHTRLLPSRSKKRKSQKQLESELETESESDSELEEEEEEEEEESELDYDAPLVHKDMVVHTLRADSVVAKGLKISKHEAETMFYGSKFLLNGQKLLKKGTKLKPGDIVDIVTERTQNKLFVKRVKVLKVEGKSSKGNDVVHIRMWRDPFEIDRPSGYHDSEDDV